MIKSAPARSLHSQVVAQLGRRIVSGEVSPGDVLPREELLAQQMGVSRTALREAMKVLAAKGLVQSRAKVGTRVRPTRYWQHLDADVLAWRCAAMPTEDFVMKLLEMREVIEPAAVAMAARRRSETQLVELEAAYLAMSEAADLEAWAVADLSFHRAILDASNNELITSLFSVIETALGAFFLLSARSAKNFKDALPSHRDVFEAIRRQRPEAARRAMLGLIASSRSSAGKRTRTRTRPS